MAEWIDHSRFAGFNTDDPWASLEHGLSRQPSDFGLPPRTFASEDRSWRTVVAVDANRSGKGDECGIVVATAPAKAAWLADHFVVLADRSTSGGPHVWSKVATSAYRHYGADRLVAEGSEDVRVILHAADATVNVELVTPTLSKLARAEPVASASEKAGSTTPARSAAWRRSRCRGFPAVGPRIVSTRSCTPCAGSFHPAPASDRADSPPPSWLASTPLEVSRASRRLPVG